MCVSRSLKIYSLTLLVVAIAWLARWVVDPQLGDHALFVTFYVAVVAATWLGGVVPGLLATGLGLVLGLYFFAAPRHALLTAASGNLTSVGLYFIVSFTIVAV